MKHRLYSRITAILMIFCLMAGLSGCNLMDARLEEEMDILTPTAQLSTTDPASDLEESIESSYSCPPPYRHRLRNVSV